MKYFWNIDMLVDLFDPTDRVRGMGRSEAMADAFIEIAKKHPDINIKFFDHYPDSQAVRHNMGHILYDKINELNDKYRKSKELRSRFVLNVDKTTIMFTYNIERYDAPSILK